MRKNRKPFYIGATVLLAALLCAEGIASYASKDEITFKVKSTERITLEDTSYYLVLTDKGAFKNSDDWWQLKFSSSDLQSKFVKDQEYTCTKNFWRIPLFSVYENLITCK